MLFRRTRLLVLAPIALSAALLLTGAAQAATHNVAVGPGFLFVPADITVNQGDTVVWTWEGGSHTVTSGTGPADPNVGVEFSSGAATTVVGTTFSHTFNSVGDFDYFCIPHFAFAMTGVVHVPGPPAVPSMGAWALLATAMLICGTGIWMRHSNLRAQFVAPKN
ncbi:MAG: plastocyanin/azurin family copper-binding protein [Myxococcota bacterium]